MDAPIAISMKLNEQLLFKATQKRGLRRNYLSWHHTATAGPSDHNTVPYTFGNTIYNAFNVDAEMAQTVARDLAGL